MSMDDLRGDGPPPAAAEPSGMVSQVTETAAATVDTAREEAAGLLEAGQGAAADLLGEASAQARDLLHEARSEVRARAQEEGSKLAATLGTTADQLRSMADHADDPHHPIAEAARQAAGRTRAMANRFESGGVDGVVADVKRFARQRPVLFLGGVLALGIVAGRVLRNADHGALADAARPDTEADGDADANTMFGAEARPPAIEFVATGQDPTPAFTGGGASAGLGQ